MAKTKPESIIDSRPLKTLYYRDEVLLRVNKSARYGNAVKNCTGYMHENRYGATSAEIIDSSKGEKLLAVLHHNVVGKIEVLYEEPAVKGQ